MKSTDQQINRSTDQQINRSTDQQINRSTLSCFLLLIILVSIGCDTQTVAVGTVADTPATLPEEVLIDAGIVFADRASYLCLPFEKVGLPSDASVASIKSSCDCLTPSLIEYVDANGHFAKAIFRNSTRMLLRTKVLGRD